MNDTFLRALRREPTDYTPLWLMRQAGRYLPEYNATRARAGSFMALATSPALACEVTLQPLDRFPLDAAILFSDILTVPDAMGLGLSFAQGEGPRFAQAVQDEAAVGALRVPDLDRLRYVFDAVREIRAALALRGDGAVPLIGFSGSPYTLACYMVEGGSSDDFRRIKSMLYARPDLLHRILDINAQSVAAYLNEQVRAGAQALMIFDTWGGHLAHQAYREFSLAYIKQVLAHIDRSASQVPLIVFTKGGAGWIEEIAATGCDAVGLDWTASLGQVRNRLQDRCAVQGNLDPMVLFGGEQAIRQQVGQLLADFGHHSDRSGHVFNLGHGISQFTPPEAVAILADAVHDQSRAYHSR